MILQHVMSGIISSRNMSNNKTKLKKNLEKLSSGYRINRAGDDAAGLAISEGLRWQIRGTDQAKRNIQDGIGLVQTADGAMQEINAMLNRARRLSTQAANGTYDEAERAMIQKEIDEIKQEISRITMSTNFNEVDLFPQNESIIDDVVEIYPVTFLPDWVDGGKAMADKAQTDVYVTTQHYEGTRDNPDGTTTIESGDVQIKHAAAILDFSKLDANNKDELIGTGFYCTCLTCSNHYSVKFTEGTGTKRVDSGEHHVYEIGIDNVTTGKDLVDTVINGLKSANAGVIDGTIVNPLGHYTMWTADPKNPDKLIIYDDRSSASSPPEIDGLKNVKWTLGSSTTKWGNVAFNTSATSSGRYGRFGRGVAYKPGTWAPPPTPDLFFQIGPSAEEQMGIILPRVDLKLLGIEKASVRTLKEANDSIEVFREATDYLDGERGRMGAYQNRLEHTYQAQSVSFENLSEAESRIRDTDVAEEVVDYTKNNILLQASQAMLLHSNMLPENILSLLR